MLYNVDIISDICKVHGKNPLIWLEMKKNFFTMLMGKKFSIKCAN